jgi:hypothetical protein
MINYKMTKIRVKQIALILILPYTTRGPDGICRLVFDR